MKIYHFSFIVPNEANKMRKNIYNKDSDIRE